MADADWKNKYFAALRSLEDDERRARDTEQALRRIVGRLCIVGRGQDDELDQGLTALAEANRKNAAAEDLGKLAAQLRDTVAAADQRTGLARTLAVEKTGTQQALAAQRWAASCEAATLVLKQLARDEHTRDFADTMLNELRLAETDEALANILTRVADALQKRGDDLAKERQQAGTLLTDMAARLDEVTAFLSGQTQDRQTALGDAEQLNNQVMQQVDSLKSEVTATDDLARIRSLVGERLNKIAVQARDYRAREESRFLEQSALTQRMTARVAELERQTHNLHRSLHQEQKKARLDPLTGIPTRATFDDRLANEIARWQRFREPVSVLVWDLDRFKSINDNYGHRAGDKVLQEVANCFAARLRATDVLARFGGEEFVMLLVGTPKADAQIVADKLRKAVESLPFVFRDTAVKVTVSCGITELRDGDSAEIVFDRADAALYKAKDGGRNLCIAA